MDVDMAGNESTTGRQAGAGLPAGTAREPMSRAVREGVRAREPEALGELFDRYFGEIYSLVFRLLNHKAAAEDVTHDIFLKVYRSAETYDPSRDPRPWLISIAYNACRDHWRSRDYKVSRQSQPLDPGDHLTETLPGDGPRPDGELMRRERERALAVALMTLPEDQRTVVLLHDYEGLKHEEIAEIVQASAAAVRKRYSRALARLYEELKDVLS
jgi:RNA polymerase sigma-70 factor (ECF subfamily)